MRNIYYPARVWSVLGEIGWVRLDRSDVTDASGRSFLARAVQPDV